MTRTIPYQYASVIGDVSKIDWNNYTQQVHNAVRTNSGGVDYIKFDTTPTVTPALGYMYWDTTEGTPAVLLDATNNVTLSIGTEGYVRAVNKTGVQINDGQVVYISGAQGNRPTITLAKADNVTTSSIIGIATQNIANNAEGFVTIYGDVHGYDTSGFVAGDKLYLSASTAGALTKTVPTSPNYVAVVATALNSTNNGTLTIHPHAPLASNTALGTDTVAPTQGAVKSYVDGTFFKLDQTTPQSIINGTPNFTRGMNINSDTYKSYYGAGNDMSVNYDGTKGVIKVDEVAASDLHISCGTDKTVILDESVWCDIDFPIIIRTTGAGIPTLTTLNGNITAPQWQVNDFNQCESQELIHEWEEGTTLYWHLHLTTNGLDATNRYVRFEVEYGYNNGHNTAWTFPATIDSGEILIPANTANKTMLIMSLGNFTPSSAKIGAHVIARLKRIASSGTAPTNDPWIPMLQLHILKNSIGSRLIGTK